MSVIVQEADLKDESELASVGDEFHWDHSILEIEVEDLQCGPRLVTDLMVEDQSMKSTVQF